VAEDQAVPEEQQLVEEACLRFVEAGIVVVVVVGVVVERHWFPWEVGQSFQSSGCSVVT